jgi:pimeloyl-ACP methyl ester carboxylesterase
MPVTRVDDVRIHFETLGDAAAEPLVLIGGSATQLIEWRDEFCALLMAEGFRVIRFDHRDTGLSQRFGGVDDVDGGYSVAQAAEDVVRILDTLGIPSAHVAGHSMGGIMAQYLAIDHPDRVRSIAVLSAIPGLDPIYLAESEAATAETVPTPVVALPRQEAIEQFVAYQRSMHMAAFAFDEEGERRHAARQIDRGYEPNAFQRHDAALRRATDRLERLRSVTVPTTVIHGRDDPQLLPLAAELTAEAIPGAELHIIEGMGHRLERELWPEYVAIITRNARRAERERETRA